MAFSLINGFGVAKLHLHAFIVTLGTQLIAYGANCLYIESQPSGTAQALSTFDPTFLNIAAGAIYIGVNRAYKLSSVVLDYLFCQDYIAIRDGGTMDEMDAYRRGECVKFVGLVGDNAWGNDFQIRRSLDVDQPLTINDLQSIVSEEQAHLDALKSIGAIIFGEVLLDARLRDTSDLLSGDWSITFNVTTTPLAKSLTAVVNWTDDGFVTYFEEQA